MEIKSAALDFMEAQQGRLPTISYKLQTHMNEGELSTYTALPLSVSVTNFSANVTIKNDNSVQASK